MSAKWCRKQVPEWKGKLPKLLYFDSADGAYNGKIFWNGKCLFSYTRANKQAVTAACESKRVEIMKKIMKGQI